MKPIKDNIGIIAQGEPTHWYVSIFDTDNSRESAEQLKQQILSDNKLRELTEKRIENIPKCLSKECMGCEWDLVRHELQKLLKDSK